MMEKDRVKEKFKLNDNDLAEIVSAVMTDGLLASGGCIVVERNGVSYDKLQSIKETIIFYSRNGKKTSSVKSLRDSVKNKVAFHNYKNVTSYIRSNLDQLEKDGLISNVKGDEFTIN